MSVGWDDDPVVASWPGLPPLHGDRTADACVIGLGASGLAAVAALAGRGLSVIGLDAGRVAAGAAGRNGGFLIGGPAPFLHDAISAWGTVPVGAAPGAAGRGRPGAGPAVRGGSPAVTGAPAAVELYRATLRELDDLAAELGPQVIRRTGSIRLAGLPDEPADDAEAADRERELADCAAHEAALREHAIAVERYDGPLGRGLFLPDDAATNPARRAVEIAGRLARSHRAELCEHTRVTRVAAGRVGTERGAVRAPVVIVAVDGWLEALLPRLAGQVRTARLQMLAGRPLGPVAADRLPGPVYGRWGYDYALRAPDGRIFAGGGRDRFAADEWLTGGPTSLTAPPAPTAPSGPVEPSAPGALPAPVGPTAPSERVEPSAPGALPASVEPTAPVQGYVDTVAARMAGGPVRAVHRWAAPVGFTSDRRALCTIVDRGPSGEIVVAIGGYSGTGNLVGPVAARAAVALALDGTPPPPYLAP